MDSLLDLGGVAPSHIPELLPADGVQLHIDVIDSEQQLLAHQLGVGPSSRVELVLVLVADVPA